MSLFPLINLSDGEKVDGWDKFHSDNFWFLYLETPGNCCPECGSLDYEKNERELYSIGQEEPVTIHGWFICNDCDQSWTSDHYPPEENDV